MSRSPLKPRRRTWWLVYATCSACVVAMLGWVSLTLLDLEGRERSLRQEVAHEEALRLALWRMDSWMLALLKKEGGRPYYEYRAYRPEQRSFGNFLREAQPGETLKPSALLTTRSEFVRLHFQVRAKGSPTSPEVPEGGLVDIAVEGCLPFDVVPANQRILDRVQALLVGQDLEGRLARLEEQEAALDSESLVENPLPTVQLLADTQQVRQQLALQNMNEYQARAKGTRNARNQAQHEANAPDAYLAEDAVAFDDVVTGPMLPLWLGEASAELFLFRRVEVGEEKLLQGVLLDWPRIQVALLTEVRDLVTNLSLTPVLDRNNEEEDRLGRTMTTIPARVEAPRLPVPPAEGLTPAQATLGVAWLAVVLALGAGGLILHSSIRFGQKRSRFASAVTHELRTPLTTFKMYSEMLADGMVRDPESRDHYLQTLKVESGRLATLVENVLSYARIEEGRSSLDRKPYAIAEILDRHRFQLEHRVAEAGMTLHVELGEAREARLETDAEVVGQILRNLVDNACKYGHSEQRPRIELTARRHDGLVELTVRDHGPGIAREAARKIFDPFERALHNDDSTPGIGLGLALCRDLAIDLGGDLRVDRGAEPGARFVLSLPLRTSSDAE